MKYYGDEEAKRLELIEIFNLNAINDSSTPIGFIKEKGLFVEYLMKYHPEGTVTQGRKKIKLKDRSYERIDITTDWMDMERFEYEGNTYYMGIYTDCLNDDYRVWKELPKIDNDKNFKWKFNRKHGTKEAVLTSGNLEFACIAKENGNVYIECKYTKCDNKHRNKVTISTIDVYNATNDDIIMAIRQWKDEFRRELAA